MPQHSGRRRKHTLPTFVERASARLSLPHWARVLLVASAAACIVGCSHGAAADPGPADVAAKKSVWKQLHRPIALPPVTGTCPRTAGARRAPRVGITLGDGPVFPVLGFAAAPPSPRGVVHYRDGVRVRGLGYAAKVLWAGSRAYTGPVLIRARRLDRTQLVHLQLGERDPIVKELRFPAGKKTAWRYWATSTILNAAGCYGYQIDGLTFSTKVVFEATR